MLTMPSSASSGDTIHGTITVKQGEGTTKFSSGLPATVLIVRDDHVVGQFSGPISGVGIERDVVPGQVLRFPAEVRLAGCPTDTAGTTDDTDATRPDLPVGRYQLVAVMETGRVAAPVDIQVTAPAS
jgi:hypothetical protein